MSDPNEAEGKRTRTDLAIGIVMIAAFFTALVFIRQDLALVYVGWCVLAIMLLRATLPGSVRIRASDNDRDYNTRLRLPAVVAGATGAFLVVAAAAPALLEVVGMIVMIGIIVFVILAVLRGGI